MPSEKKQLDPLEEVDLDPENPRIPLEERSDDQRTLLAYMVENFKVVEVAESIAASGFVPQDPLVGYFRNGRVTVREGNRRIAALKGLGKPEDLPASFRARFEALKARMTPEHVASMARVPVDVYTDINDVDIQAYVGFRHVTGPLPWAPEEKARFIADLIERHHWTYKEIATRLGSHAKHVERLYIAHRTLQQALEEEIEGADKITLGIFVRALQTSGISEYLGLKYTGDPSTNKKPVPADKQQRLGEIVRWIFGTPKLEPVLSDSRQLTALGEILLSEEATEYLRTSESPDLEVARRQAGGGKELVLRGLIAAAQKLEEIAAWIPDVAEEKGIEETALRCGRRLVTIARDVPPLAKFLRDWASKPAAPG